MADHALTETDIDAYPEQAAQITGLFAEAQQVIADALDALHQEADPDQRGQIAAVTRQWCDYVVALADEQRALTGAAAEMANAAMRQRDEAIRALDALVTAIDDLDTDNPRVAGLVEAVEEAVHEGFMDGGFHSYCPGCDLIEADIPVSHEAANEFISLLFGYADELDEDLRQRAGDFINEFVAEVNRRAAERD